MVDFSYLMILELREYYHAKCAAFNACLHSCQELCNLAYTFYSELDPALDKIYKYASSLQHDSEGTTHYQIVDFGTDLKYQAIYAAEEIIGIGAIIGPLYQEKRPPINLSTFEEAPFAQESSEPDPTLRLRNILQAVVQRIYRSQVTVQTEHVQNQRLSTNISGNGFGFRYMQVNTETLTEQEGYSIYEFMKKITNILSYSIIDINYPVLERMVSEINWYNIQITQLEVAVNKAAAISHHLHDNTKDMHQKLTDQVPHEELADINTLVKDLLQFTQNYSRVADNLLESFRNTKKKFRLTTLADADPPYVMTPQRWQPSWHQLQG